MTKQEAATPKEQPRIMIVDDEPSNIKVLTRILNLNGYENIKPVEDSLQVLDEFKRWQPDIILLDLMMPCFNGLDVLEQINQFKNSQYLPVIMITADESMENRIRALEMGANDYISKPFNAQELVARIQNLIKVKASMDQALATETAFLQAQIQPHFLYNTLNTISSFCDTEPEKASSLIDDFSSYLRQSFDLKTLQPTVPINRELQLVRSFVEIQKARFGDRVSFELVPLQNMAFSLPPLCIQPLVENSIRHGLKVKQKVTVRVAFVETTGGISVLVQDDGPGIPAEKMPEILVRSANKGIGIWNIDARLKRVFGTGLIIRSTEQGTSVRFDIPGGNMK